MAVIAVIPIDVEKIVYTITSYEVDATTGGPDEGYAGRYDIRYFDGKGNALPGLKLDIQKDGDYYEIAWIDDGEVVYRGIGMEVAEGLIAGWRGIDDKPPQPFETQA